MKNTMLTRLAAAACLVGGLIFLLDFTLVGWVLKMNFLSSVKPAANLARTALWCVSAVGLTGGAVGLYLVGATGTGWQKKLGFGGMIFNLLGAISYIAGTLFIYNFPERATKQIFTPGGSLLLTVGMLMLGGAVLAAGVWRGWLRFIPLLVGLYFPVQLPLQIIFFLGQGKGPNPFLLGVWGILWALLGAVLWKNISKTESFEIGLEKPDVNRRKTYKSNPVRTPPDKRGTFYMEIKLEKEVIFNPVTSERLLVLETNEDVFKMGFSINPCSEIAGEHFHPFQEQRILVTGGELHCTIGGKNHVLRAGESATIPPGVRHFQHNPTAAVTTAVEEYRPAGKIHNFFRVLFKLAAEGKTNRKGVPNPLIGAALMAEFKDTVRASSLGLRMLFSALAPLSRLLGYRKTIRTYVEKFEAADRRPEFSRTMVIPILRQSKKIKTLEIKPLERG